MPDLTTTVSPYRPRLADPYLAELVADWPAVMITGARATGKTTTARQLAKQVDRLDQPAVAASYRADPDAALRRGRRPLLLDEWQQVPEVLAAVKRSVDDDDRPGQFILTGGVRADMSNETWAGTGRVVRMSMYPLAQRELRGGPLAGGTTFVERLAAGGAADLRLPSQVPVIDEYMAMAMRGGFPEVAYADRSPRSQGIWLSSYLDDLVTRDAAIAGAPKDPVKLSHYLRALALNNAGMPSDNSLDRVAGLNAKTGVGYDQLLRNLYVLDVAPAWSSNRLNRLVKQAKRYFVDTGLAAVAAGLTISSVLNNPNLVGRFFDAFVAAQLRPEIAQSQPLQRLHHIRTEAGRREIDLVIELDASRVVAIEVKATSAPGRDDAKHLFWLRDTLGDDFAAGAVLHSGQTVYELGDRVYAVPVCAIWG